jgi:hypothetical protein
MQRSTGRILYEHSWGDVHEWATAIRDLADWSEGEIDRAVQQVRPGRPRSRSAGACDGRPKERVAPASPRSH